MDNETQNQFNHAIFWRARQQGILAFTVEVRVVELLAHYRALTLKDRLALVKEYKDRKVVNPTPIVSPQIRISRFFSKFKK